MTVVKNHCCSLSRARFLQVLSGVHAVAQNAQAGDLGLPNVLLTICGNLLTVVGASLELTVKAEVPCTSESDVFFLVSSGVLLEIVRKLSHEVIELSQAENCLTVSTPSSRFQIPVVGNKQYQYMRPCLDGHQFVMQSHDLQALLERVFFSAAVDDARYYLCTVCLVYREDRLYSMATDGHRVAWMYHVAIGDLEHRPEFLHIKIPRRTVQELIRYTRLFPNQEIKVASPKIQEGSMSRDAEQISFIFPGVTLVSRLLGGRYPYQQCLKVQPDPEHYLKVELPLSLMRTAIQRVITILLEKVQGVTLTVSPGSMVVNATSKLYGSQGEETIELQKTSFAEGQYQLAFNAQYVLDVLRHIESEVVTFMFSRTATARQPIFFLDQKCERVMYSVMPLKLNDEVRLD